MPWSPVAFPPGQHFPLPTAATLHLHMALSRWLSSKALYQQITTEKKQPLMCLSLLTKPKPWVQFLHPWQIRLAKQALDSSSKSSKEYTSKGIEKRLLSASLKASISFRSELAENQFLHEFLFFSFRTTLQSDQVKLTICCGEKYSYTQDHIIKLLCKLYMQAVPVRIEVIVIMLLNIRSGFK